VRPGPNERLLVLGICTLAETPALVTMNLQGPVVINQASRRGKQLVLNHSGYGTQHRLSEGLVTRSAATQPAAARPVHAGAARVTA